ncbi:monosaccharide ABC transporter substrate-binding protein, CUT2 family [Mesobacillus persicus]|uniref:Monosaccharide ABC transporter substrate-binding protein, CUT2 family n=1 Tax=Mesobacillus persicus TaxID=930146 RepID=A0A1H8FY38_9BACI|nr:sugar-binding protein [Mesobacillus persicus]SEN36559.1 monosaccharide ABC transporter substrate-binding protein, CUT2 family [Mesobacillus persicus]
MKQNYFILALFVTVLCISLIFSFYFFKKTVHIETPMNNNDMAGQADMHFVLIIQELESPYLQDLYAGAKAGAGKNGVTIEYWGTEQTNVDDHIKLIEMAIASKVDGILTQGLTQEFEPVINKAEEKGIPVIFVDSDLENNDERTYVGTDNYQAGYEMGLTVLDETSGKIKVGILNGNLININLEERVQGFLDAISTDNRMEVVAIESSNMSKIQGAEKTYQMLKSHPDISILFGTSALDSFGIVEGIKKAKPSSEVRVYAFDVFEETFDLLKTGGIHTALKQEPYQMGYTGVNLLIDLIQGKEIEKNIYTPISILTKEDVEND